jgi:diaminohydroxyphosphoribosylaminopyrimidine deaminase/5-amino-6-(5-phosphoribosylamino)uracil reductase
MTGAGTVLADDPELTVRGVRGAINPTRVIVDSSASIPLDARVLNSSAPTIVAVTERAPAGRIEEIRGAGVTVLVLPEKNSMVDIRALMIVLASMGVNSVLLECGGGLAASMLAEGLIDKGIAFIAPKIIGGRGAKTPVEGAGIELMSQAQEVSITRVRRVGEDVAFEFSIRR